MHFVHCEIFDVNYWNITQIYNNAKWHKIRAIMSSKKTFVKMATSCLMYYLEKKLAPYLDHVKKIHDKGCNTYHSSVNSCCQPRYPATLKLFKCCLQQQYNTTFSPSVNPNLLKHGHVILTTSAVSQAAQQPRRNGSDVVYSNNNKMLNFPIRQILIS